MNTEELRNKILVKEYFRLCKEIRAIEARIDTFLFAGFAVVSALAALALMFGLDELFVLFPLAIIGLWCLLVHAYVAIFSFAGNKKHFEEKLNQAAGSEILLWEQLVPKRERRHALSRFLLLIIQAAYGLAIIGFSVMRVDESFGEGVPFSIFLIALGLMLGFSFSRLPGEIERSYQDSKSLV